MNDYQRAFRDYATRVSFNLSLSRNQVGHLAGIVTEIESYRANKRLGWLKRTDIRDAAVENYGGRPNMFIVGRGSLRRMGLIKLDPMAAKDEEAAEAARAAGIRRYDRYDGPRYRLTPAGEHIVELLRIAGLIPKAAANLDHKKRRRAA